MTLHVTPEMVAAAYEFLRTTLPFRRWKLPHADEIVFRVTLDHMRLGHFRRDRYDRREITVSARSVGHTCTLIETVGHEMIHLHEDIRGTLYKTRAEHSGFFRRQAALACKYHGWDPRVFC